HALETRRVLEHRYQRARGRRSAGQFNAFRVHRHGRQPGVVRQDLGQLAQDWQWTHAPGLHAVDDRQQLALALEVALDALDGLHVGVEPRDLRVDAVEVPLLPPTGGEQRD